MDARAFAASVARSKPPVVSDQSLRQAIEHYVSVGRTQQSDVSPCITLAGQVEANLAHIRKNPEMADRHPLPLTVGLTVRSEDLIRHLTPTVKKVRQELFGGPCAPFSSYEETSAWIEQMGQRQDYTVAYETTPQGLYSQKLVVNNPQFHQQRMVIVDQIQNLYRQYTALTGETVPGFKPNERRLYYLRPYPSGGLWEESFPACTGSPLARLADISQEMAEATGFYPPSIVMLILMNKKPLLLQGTVTIDQQPHKQFGTERVQVTVVINTPDMTEARWLDIHQSIRQAWRVENTRPIDAHNHKLHSIVAEYGGVPTGHGSKKPFWEKLRQEWNRREDEQLRQAQARGEEYHPRLFSTWKSLSNAYSRLRKKLTSRPSEAKEPQRSISLRTRVPIESIEARRMRDRRHTRPGTRG
jgi:hypothetical protein